MVTHVRFLVQLVVALKHPGATAPHFPPRVRLCTGYERAQHDCSITVPHLVRGQVFHVGYVHKLGFHARHGGSNVTVLNNVTDATIRSLTDTPETQFNSQ